MPSRENPGGFLKWKCLVFVALHNRKSVTKEEFESFMKSETEPRSFPSLDKMNVIGLTHGVCGVYAPAPAHWNTFPLAKITDDGQIAKAWTALKSWTMSDSDPYNAFTIASESQWTTLFNSVGEPWKSFGTTLKGDKSRAKTLQAKLFGGNVDARLLTQALIDPSKISGTHKLFVTQDAFEEACKSVSAEDDRTKDTNFEAGKETLETFTINIQVQSFISRHRFLSSVDCCCRSNSREIEISQKQPHLVHASAIADKIY